MNPEELLNPEGSENNSQPKESPLVLLKRELDGYKDTLKQVALDIRVEGLSEQPIFIAHQHEVSIGEIILDRKELGTEWTIQASTLEEFLSRGIIQESKKDVFLYSYKNPDEYACIFVVVPEGANFVFIPY
jgi:hypothetical protein